MYVTRNDTGEEIFRGSLTDAKRIFGTGSTLMDHVSDPETGEVLQAGKVVEMSVVYELTAEEQRAYLADTDWYITRQQETGREVPQAVLDKRAAARAFLNQ
jgi:hypothetical protein